jgi:hypothetical protein
VKLIAISQRRGNIANKAFQGAPAPEHAKQQISRIDLREPARWQLEHVVRSTISECAHDYNVACFRRLRAGDKRDSFRECKR